MNDLFAQFGGTMALVTAAIVGLITYYAFGRNLTTSLIAGGVTVLLLGIIPGTNGDTANNNTNGGGLI